ncbi:Threonine/homoserine/homoserine lactone efflux protein [Ferrimonas sediminum]|uniref:Threonine/homoserine/homoserine lactone efflux protein n=1 Tax=Ferrimonas sediminum TaxID=718193 RepID=A0A1G8S9Y6_9GAMM|nr:LysE family translocator [Ferrimonas sediminum]SDJ26029.1 Threonine/homoserine/homoserine lactone efflux protein [Ferrimonas sediminum]
MPDWSTLLIFLPTFFAVSITPGLCMLLALSLGMTIGLKRTLPMMAGELVGVAIVAISALLGVSALLLAQPSLLLLLQGVGGGYLIYLGLSAWRRSGQLDAGDCVTEVSPRQLFVRGLTTALANPKGWAFMVSLLPPFIDHQRPLLPQLGLLLAIILCCELVCMALYATGGSRLRRLLRQDNVRRLHRLSGSVMLVLGVWLWLS